MGESEKIENKNYFYIKYVPKLSDTLFDVILKKNMKIVVYLLNTYSTVPMVIALQEIWHSDFSHYRYTFYSIYWYVDE